MTLSELEIRLILRFCLSSSSSECLVVAVVAVVDGMGGSAVQAIYHQWDFIC